MGRYDELTNIADRLEETEPEIAAEIREWVSSEELNDITVAINASLSDY